jgi:hypothetical protein
MKRKYSYKAPTNSRQLPFGYAQERRRPVALIMKLKNSDSDFSIKKQKVSMPRIEFL